MTIFRRINDLLTANLNDLVDRFENPEKMMRQALREVDDAIAEATSATARSIAGQKLMGKEIESQRGQAARWQRKAAAAVAAGDDDQARRALVRRREHERLLSLLAEQLAASEVAGARLRRRIDALKIKRAEAGRMLVALTARQCLAQAYQSLGDCAFGAATSPVLDRFERFRRRIELAEAESEALFELTADDDGDSAIREGDETAEVEAELVQLKHAHRM